MDAKEMRLNLAEKYPDIGINERVWGSQDIPDNTAMDEGELMVGYVVEGFTVRAFTVKPFLNQPDS